MGIDISTAGISSVHLLPLLRLVPAISHILPAVAADDLPFEPVHDTFPIHGVRLIFLMHDLPVLVEDFLHPVKQFLADNRLMHPFQYPPFFLRYPVSPDPHIKRFRDLPIDQSPCIDRIGKDIDQRPTTPHGMLILLGVPDAQLDLPSCRRYRAHIIQPPCHFRMAHPCRLPLKQHPDIRSDLFIHVITKLPLLRLDIAIGRIPRKEVPRFLPLPE